MDRPRPKFLLGLLSIGSSSVVSMACGLLALAISARVLNESELGTFFLLFALISLLDVLGEGGLRHAAARSIAGTQSDREKQLIIGTLLTVKIGLLLLIVLLALILKPLLIGLFFSEKFEEMYFLVPLFFCLQSMELLLDSILQGFQLYSRLALIRTGKAVLQLGLIIFFLLSLKMGLFGFILAYVLSIGCSVLVQFLLIPGKRRLMFDRSVARRLLTFGAPLLGNNFLSFISQRLDLMIVGVLSSPAAVGFLGVAAKIPETLERVFTTLFSVYLPHTSGLFGQGKNEEAVALMGRFLRILSLGICFGALGAVLFRNEIVITFFSQRYLPAAPAFGGLAIILCVSMISLILDYTLISAGHPKYIPLINLSDSVPSITANLILIPIFGFMGAVLAKGLAQVISNPLTVWFLRREGIDVDMGSYLKPFGIMLACLGIDIAAGGLESIASRAGLMLLFLVFAAAIQPQLRTDLHALVCIIRVSRQEAG